MQFLFSHIMVRTCPHHGRWLREPNIHCLTGQHMFTHTA
jgi:hypothetical protein